MSYSTERNCNKCIHHTSGECDSWNCKMQTVEDVKKEAVNEYVKSVVKELEELRKKDVCDYLDCDVCSYTDKCSAETDQSNNLKWNKAIEIVKQGGVSDDVCEWTQSGDMAISPHTFSKYKIKQCDGLYALSTCPYCGKKIKVVE